jgi:hypothetical protein
VICTLLGIFSRNVDFNFHYLAPKSNNCTRWVEAAFVLWFYFIYLHCRLLLYTMDRDPDAAHSLVGEHKLDDPRDSLDGTDSTTSIVLEHLNGRANRSKSPDDLPYSDKPSDLLLPRNDRGFDPEEGDYVGMQPVDRKARKVLWIVLVIALIGWILVGVQFIAKGNYKHASTRPHDPAATASRGSGRKVTLDQVLGATWKPIKHSIEWIPGPEGEDGLLLERGGSKGFLDRITIRPPQPNMAESQSSKGVDHV